MGWTDLWTPAAWNDLAHVSPAKQTEIARVVNKFAGTGLGPIARDGPGTGEGRLIVGNWRVSIARRDTYRYLADDGDYVVVHNAIVVLGAVAIDPDDSDANG